MKGIGTGFFCKIPVENREIPVLITNNHLIDKEILKKNNIYVTLNDDKEKINIVIDDNRKLYTSEKYDTTIIEIKPEKDKIKYFLELDEDIFQDNIFEENIALYILFYSKYFEENKARVSYQFLNKIIDFELIYYGLTEQVSSGSPILKLSNKKVIGMHIESNKFCYNKLNKGIFLKKPINEYINNINIIDIKNEIRLKLKIGQKDINERIYFLSCVLFEDNIDEYHIFNQLNESNTDLFIDGKKYTFQKYFRFENEGIYSIKIKIKKNLYNCIKDCQSMFYNCENIIDIDLSSFDTKDVTNMSYMFRNCYILSNINLSNLNTKNVTNMKFMFEDCRN